MQKPKVRDGFILLPVPAEVAEELELDPFTTIQFTISGNRLIIEAIDAEHSMVCFGNCCRCPCRNCCEDVCL